MRARLLNHLLKLADAEAIDPIRSRDAFAKALVTRPASTLRLVVFFSRIGTVMNAECTRCEDPPSIGPVQLRIAQERDEYRKAFQLVHRGYLRGGLCRPCESGMRATEFQLLESSRVFIATLGDEVVSTLSLVMDDELGLPMETTYPSLIRGRRRRGLRVAEVTCLADRRESPKRFFEVFSALSRVMAQYAKQAGVDEIWIACHPKHSKLYERRLAFSRRGDLRDYPDVLGNPALALCLDLNALPESHPKIHQRYFGEAIAADHLASEPMSLMDREYFAEHAVSRSEPGRRLAHALVA